MGYEHHHEPDKFPIYYSFVDKMLKHYRKVDNFKKFKNNDLKNYPMFINIIEELMGFYKVNSFTLRELDIFLWLAGKEFFPNKYNNGNSLRFNEK